MKSTLLTTIFQGLDFITFSIMVSRFGIVVEANPLIAPLFTGFGLIGVLLAKITLISFVTSIVNIIWDNKRARIIVVIVAIGAGIIGTISNLNARVI